MTVIMIVTLVGAAASLLASCVSIAIGLVAIWLVTNFYRNSMELSVRTKESLKDMDAAVARLEGLLGGRYAAGVPKVVPPPASCPEPPPSAAKSAGTPGLSAVPGAALNDGQLQTLKTEIQAQVTSALKGQRIKGAKAENLRGQIAGIFDQFMASTKDLVEDIKDVADEK